MSPGMKVDIRRRLVFTLFLASVSLAVASEPAKLSEEVAKREAEIVKAVKRIAPHLAEMAKKQYGISVMAEEIQANGVHRAVKDKVDSANQDKRPSYEIGVEFNKRFQAVLTEDEGKYFEGFSYHHFITRDFLIVVSATRKSLDADRLLRLKRVSEGKEADNTNASLLLALAVLYADPEAVREFAKLAKDTEEKGYHDFLGLDAAINAPDRFLVRERIYIAIKAGLDSLPAPRPWTKPSSICLRGAERPVATNDKSHKS
jgi:hypothetical protein